MYRPIPNWFLTVRANPLLIICNSGLGENAVLAQRCSWCSDAYLWCLYNGKSYSIPYGRWMYEGVHELWSDEIRKVKTFTLTHRTDHDLLLLIITTACLDHLFILLISTTAVDPNLRYCAGSDKCAIPGTWYYCTVPSTSQTLQ